MNDLSKKIIDSIIDYPIDKDIVFGDYISPILFPADKFAIYFENDNATPYALYFTPESNKGNEEFLSLLEIISMLSKLEEENLIFVTNGHGKTKNLFYRSKIYLQPTYDPNVDRINKDGDVLRSLGSYSKSIEKDGIISLKSHIVPKPCFEQLQRFFTSIILPTSALKELKKRRYLTVEEYNTKEALRIGRIGNGIAVLAVCVSIAVNYHQNNPVKINNNTTQQISTTDFKSKQKYKTTIIYQDSLSNIKKQLK